MTAPIADALQENLTERVSYTNRVEVVGQPLALRIAHHAPVSPSNDEDKRVVTGVRFEAANGRQE